MRNTTAITISHHWTGSKTGAAVLLDNCNLKMESRKRALSLMRKLMRVGRAWPEASERTFILNSTRQEFRQNRSLEGEDALEKISDGEDRLEMGIHYGSPYPRINHMGGGGAEGITHYKQNAPIARGRKKINVNGKSVWHTPTPKK